MTIPSGQSALYLLDPVRLNHVIDLDVVVAGHLNTTLEALADLADILFEALERVQAHRSVRGRINDHAAADNADLGGPLDGALGDVAARDSADPADLERLPHHGPAQVNDLFTRLEFALQGRTDIVGQLV